MGEIATTALLCWLLSGGATEIRHEFPTLGRQRAVRVDCETDTHVIEVTLDGKASARDSVHQAVFASILTGKKPMVIVIDRDGKVDRYQYELQVVSERLNIAYATCSQEYVIRWVESAGWSGVTTEELANGEGLDLACELGEDFALPPMN